VFVYAFAICFGQRNSLVIGAHGISTAFIAGWVALGEPVFWGRLFRGWSLRRVQLGKVLCGLFVKVRPAIFAAELYFLAFVNEYDRLPVIECFVSDDTLVERVSFGGGAMAMAGMVVVVMFAGSTADERESCSRKQRDREER
jgi:hypothetical protein